MQLALDNGMWAEAIQVTSKLKHLIPGQNTLESSFLHAEPIALEMEGVLPGWAEV